MTKMEANAARQAGLEARGTETEVDLDDTTWDQPSNVLISRPPEDAAVRALVEVLCPLLLPMPSQLPRPLSLSAGAIAWTAACANGPLCTRC